MSSLLAALNGAGYYAAPLSYGSYNLQLRVPMPTPGNMAYFAYDLSAIDAGLQVFAAQIPEPGVLSLLGLGGLAALRRRSRRA